MATLSVRPASNFFRTATFRFSALYVVLFGASALILGAAVFAAARSALEQQRDAKLEAEISYLDNELATGGRDRVIALVTARGRGASALDYLLQDANGAHLAGEMPNNATLHAGWTTIDVPHAREDGGRPERVRARVAELGDGLLIAVGDDVDRIRDVEEAIATAFLWTVTLAAALGIGGGIFMSRAFLRRVDGIARTAEAIIEGDLDRRVPTNGANDDLDRLAATLNRMLDRIGLLLDSLRQVSTDVAHDLRTPLSRLLHGLEYARTHARTDAEHQSAIEAAMREAESLLGTFSALLRVAQVEGAPHSAIRTVDLSAAVESVVDAYRPDAEEGGHSLTDAIEPQCLVDGDKELLTQAAANLVENALKHTPTGTRIFVRLHRDRNAQHVLVVEDDGPGVAPPDVSRLTRRFFRAEPSRTTRGNGLGLSLVAAVADFHRAELDIENARPGLRVTLSIPVAAN
jgi:signal transduction histidine kinase